MAVVSSCCEMLVVPQRAQPLILCCQRLGRELKGDAASDKLEEGGMTSGKSSWPYDRITTRATMAHIEATSREQADPHKVRAS